MFAAADALLVPTIPATLSARTLDQLAAFLAAVDDPPVVLPFISMIDRRRTVHRTVAAELAAAWPQLLATASRAWPPSSGWASNGRRSARSRRPPGAPSPIRELWAEIAVRLWS